MSDETFNFRMVTPRPELRFDILAGPRTGEKLTVNLPEPGEPPILIGRSRECTIWIDASDISRRHTEIFSSPDRRPMIRDMGSVNGTLVNGQPASQTAPWPLNPGDHIRVGLTELVYVGLLAPAPQQPQPAQLTYMPQPPSVTTSPSSSNSVFSSTIGSGVTAPAPLKAATLPGEYYIYLMVRNGPRYLFEGEEATVGRGQVNDIVIDSNSISRQHSRLQKTVAGVVVADLGSTNKTFVNGVQADQPALLRDGDLIRFGDIEVDFKLEPQRLTTSIPLVGRSGLEPDISVTDPAAEITHRDAPLSDVTFVGNAQDNTFIGTPGWTPPNKSTFEQSETALDLDIRAIALGRSNAIAVGRNLRQSADVVPEIPAGAARNTSRSSGPLTELARLEGVYLTEGTGRAVDLLLDNVRLGLKPGELVALVGPSGSGKTELLRVMAGMQAADRGHVTVMGRTFPTVESSGGNRPNLEGDRELNRWRLQNIGYLPGEPDFNPKQSALELVMWVLEQAGFGRDPRERAEKAQEQLRQVGFSDPEVMRMRPFDLNRAERKQLALARALVMNPPLLLADEPTGKVPGAAADRIFILLKQLVASGKTVFMVTSDQLWARNADRQIEILDGTIVGGLS